MSVYTLSDIRRAIAARVAALTPHFVEAASGSNIGDTSDPNRGYAWKRSDEWREADWPLLPVGRMPDHIAHLSFSVVDQRVDTTDGYSLASPAFTGERVTGVYALRFLFELPSREAINGWDAAGVAAQHVRGHLLELGWEPDGVTLDSASPFCLRTPTHKQDYLLVETALQVSFNANLTL